MIKLQQLNKVYTTQEEELPALVDINLIIQPGEIFGVIGKSGAGKSTLIRCVNLLERPSSGAVIVNNQNLLDLAPAALRLARQQMGMIFQHFNLLNYRTVFENVALPLELIGWERKKIRQEVMPLLELVGLQNKPNAYPAQLSGGQKQRVAIARALATRPKILLCDEMTSSLDPETTRSILELIQAINQQLDLSILLITHEMTVIKTIADRVAVMSQGRIIEEADIFTLFTQPKTAITKSFIRSSLSIELPVSIKSKIQSSPIETGGCVIWRLAFSGASAAQPIISDLLKSSPVHFNILQANIEFIRHKPLGVMIIAVNGELEQIQLAKVYLENRCLTVEVMGYVASDDLVVY